MSTFQAKLKWKREKAHKYYSANLRRLTQRYRIKESSLVIQ